MTTGGVMNLDEMLTRNTAELEAAEAELHAVQQRVDELRTINEGMRLALERYGRASTTEQAQAAPRDQGASRAKTAASSTRRPRRKSTKRSQPQEGQRQLCLGALARYGEPASSAEAR